MSRYRTLLALHPVEDPLSALRPITTFAHALEAHLDTVVLDRLAPIPTMALMRDPTCEWNVSLPEQFAALERRSNAVERYLEDQGVEGSVNAEAQPLGLIDRAVATAALASDLVVLTQPKSGPLVEGTMGRALEGALFGAGKPVLVLEDAEAVPQPHRPGDVIVAWDGGREAARAVQSALPLLIAAERVMVMVVESSGEFELDESARRLRRHLLRHGIEAGIERVAPAGRFVTHAFAEHVAARSPDLLVMGAYGHARLRERLFSGVTRTALTELRTSLLLAH